MAWTWNPTWAQQTNRNNDNDMTSNHTTNKQKKTDGARLLDGAAEVAVDANEVDERFLLDGGKEPFEMCIADTKLA